MEQNADVGTSIMPTVDNKRKSGNGLKITTAIACIVAVCGIGFGIYGMVQSLQKDNQIADLKSQIEKNNQEISEFYYIQYTSGGGFGTMAETSSKTIIIGTEGKVKFTNDYGTNYIEYSNIEPEKYYDWLNSFKLSLPLKKSEEEQILYEG